MFDVMDVTLFDFVNSWLFNA